MCFVPPPRPSHMPPRPRHSSGVILISSLEAFVQCDHVNFEQWTGGLLSIVGMCALDACMYGVPMISHLATHLLTSKDVNRSKTIAIIVTIYTNQAENRQMLLSGAEIFL